MMSEKASSALRSVFPTTESYSRFAINGQNSSMLRSFCKFAFKNNVINADDEELLENFVQQNAIGKEECRPPANINFEIFFDQKESLLELTLSSRALTDRINDFLMKHHIELPKVSNSMLTRLKKEAADTQHKQNVLRSLAFWIGYQRPNLALRWNFETLCLLCSEGKPSQEHKEGVRIGFALVSRGEVIDHEIISWLKSNLKNYIETSIQKFCYGRWGKVRSHDITTLYVDFPKEEANLNPGAYRRCLHSALALSHQIALRWALSPHHTQNRFLSIGIAIGEYAQIDKQLYPVLIAKLPGDPVIRLTNYTRQCILINGIRVLCCNQPLESHLFSGETLAIWWVVGFWSTLYFDFIPELLSDPLIGKTSFSIKDLYQNLWSPASREQVTEKLNTHCAISTYFKFPQNAVLGIEIAKTLYYRLRFWEAIEIIRIVLSLNPTNIIARTLRMILLGNLAMHAPSHDLAEDLFAKAHNEALFIQENCSLPTEDFYCAHAGVYLCQAMLVLRHLRSGKSSIEGRFNPDEISVQILDYLDKSESLFAMGEMVSSTGMRSAFLQNFVRVIKAALISNPKIFVDASIPIDASPEIIRKSTLEFQWQTGYDPTRLAVDSDDAIKARMTLNDYLIRKDSIGLSAYKTTFYFSAAVVLWDFLPTRTVENGRMAIKLLHKARALAEELRKSNICLYAFTRAYGEMIPAEEFIRHMTKLIKTIESQAGADLDKRDGKEIISMKDKDRMHLLATLNF